MAKLLVPKHHTRKATQGIFLEFSVRDGSLYISAHVQCDNAQMETVLNPIARAIMDQLSALGKENCVALPFIYEDKKQ